MSVSTSTTLYEKTKELLYTLISINSENPDMNPAAKGEAEIASFIQDYLNKVGIETTSQEVLINRSNVYGLLKAGKKVKETLVIEVHMDTVPIQQCLGPRVEDDVIFGRGACDVKGSLSAVLLTLEELSKCRDLLPVNVLFLATIDEEYRYRGVLKAIEYLKSREDLNLVGAVVGEPTDLKVVIAHKSCLRWTIKILGKASHSGQPDNGLNAIYIMSEFVQNIREKWSKEVQKCTHLLLGDGTFNIGTINGGGQVNIVPEYCEIVMERRLLPNETEEEVLKSCDEVLFSLEKKYSGARIIREDPFLTDYPLDTDRNEPVVKKMLNSIQNMTKENSEVQGVPYGTDASKISHIGNIPSIVVGPGSIDDAHTENEKIQISDVVKAKEIYEHFILNW